MGRLKGDVLIVGSAPFETVGDALQEFATRLGDRVSTLPDGEVGVRNAFINVLPQLTYDKNPDLEPINVVSIEKAVQEPDEHGYEAMLASLGTYKLKPGVTETRFDLHFGHAAVESYETFARLRDEGVIGEGVRFQVDIPTTANAIDLFFPVPSDRPIVVKAYEESVKEMIALLLRTIPADSLAIQLDYCAEVVNCSGALDDLLPDGSSLPPLDVRLAYYTSAEYLSPLAEAIPDEVVLGYHLCYGTWGGWPGSRVPDLGLITRLANGLVANTHHRVDYVHLPTMPNPTDEFFAPLADLDIGDTKVFLGIELADGIDALMRRIEQARRHLPDFGLAHYCGYGRERRSRVIELLEDLRVASDYLTLR
ncbi:hypothetical protein [Mycolicibacterium moriokaense]|uniref:Methionine synthase n=1 Tax=Mycolicibacterium moriokaense TaxID=39691 RepID=A0A318H6V4_9MYCO|nr:hypothetical protein [Mycolicibacterium moriokaense]PXX00358.1 hypothetical protein C8E89_13410 [Mycolicibacterium moriokaense]